MPKVVSPVLPGSSVDPRIRLGLSLLGLLLLLGLGTLLVTDHLYNQEQFNIRKITLTGDAAHVDRKQLQASVIEMIEGNYFSLNSANIVEAISILPWVDTVRLRRQWPDTLTIDIEEYQPIAHWGEEQWLTTTGKLVTLPLAKNVVLPQLDGPLNSTDRVWKTYQSWSALFARNGIRLRKMKLSKQHLYTLNLEYTTYQENAPRGFEMVLAEGNADQQLVTFLSSRRQALIDFPRQIKTVDLRYTSGFSISRYEPNKLANSALN